MSKSLGFVFVGTFISFFVCSFYLANKVDLLIAENERLRLFNAREVRRYKRPTADPRWDSINRASHLFGTPSELIGGVWMSENGPPDIETGMLGKTAMISKNVPMSEWPAYETARTLNVWAWDWLINTKDGRKVLKQVLAHTAKPYTNMSRGQQEAWVRNASKYLDQFKKENSHGPK